MAGINILGVDLAMSSFLDEVKIYLGFMGFYRNFERAPEISSVLMLSRTALGGRFIFWLSIVERYIDCNGCW